jgi:hypothetical protein
VFSDPLNSTEGQVLLSGIPQYPGEKLTVTIDDIASRVNKGNEIILQIFQVVCSATKEPFFAKNQWTTALALFADVARKRADSIGLLIRDLGLSTDQIYDAVWKDTISLAIQIERLALQEGHRQILDYGIAGPVQHFTLNSVPAEGRAPCFRFIDCLAEERDALWKTFRISLTPAVTLLPQYVSHGLPIQYLLGNWVNLSEAAGMTPFLFNRAKGVVFPEPIEILSPVPDDDDIRKALEGYVDSYKVALDIYVSQSSGADERQKRIKQAWTYAIEKLSVVNGRMTREEAVSTWAPTYNDYNVSSTLFPFEHSIHIKGPLLLLESDGLETVEWNPADNFSTAPAIKSRPLELTFLDYSMQAKRDSFSTPALKVKAETRAYIPRPLALASSHWLEEPFIREGLQLSALLYLDSKIKGPRSILSSPFPSAKNIRYPAVFLADEFLQQNYLNDSDAFDILETRFLSIVPPSLLLSLSKAALDDLEKTKEPSEEAEVTNRAYRLLRLLIRCDNPSLGIDLVLDTILNRPGDSSWHRQLLTEKFLRRLSAKQAQDLIRKFSASIQKRLLQQSKQASKTTQTNSETQLAKRTFVKITTVKQLAQILNNSPFITKSFAIDTLVDLIQTAKHIDIRVALIESLLNQFIGCTNAQEQKIISGLEYMIPVGGCINERTPLTEDMWRDAETNKTPPPIIYAEDKKKCLDSKRTDIHLDIFQTLFKASYKYRQSSSPGENWKNELKTRIIFPMIKQSITTNSRWLKIFATKYLGSDLSSLKIPMLPLYPEMLNCVVNNYQWGEIPAFIQKLYFQFIMTNLAPSRELIEFNNKLQDPLLRSNPDVWHWISLYERRWGREFKPPGREPILFDPIFFRRILYWKDSYDGKDCMQLDETMRCAFTQAKVLAVAYAATGEFAAFMDIFYVKNDQSNNYDPDYDKLRNVAPIIRKLIAYIDGLRTAKWQSNPARKPPILESILKYRLWFLPRPWPQSEGSRSEEEKVSTYCKAVRGVIDEICADGKPYHLEFPTVTTAVQEVHYFYRAAIACELGSLKEDLNIQDYMCIQLAETLFKMQNHPQDQKITTRSREVIHSWQNCKDELLRLKGRNLGLLDAYEFKPWGEILLQGKETSPVPDIRTPNPETYVRDMINDLDGSWINI